MMLGEATPATLLAPGNAQAGDALLLTKALAIEGTALLARERHQILSDRLGDDVVADAERLMVNPGISIVRDAELALAAGGVSALHDPTEGGLLTAARELAAASNLGLEIDASAVPILPETLAVTEALALDPLGMLASGALLIAADPEAVRGIIHSLSSEEIPGHVIGHLTPEPEEAILLVDGVRRGMPVVPVDEVARELSHSDS
jgi:hydrogenase maturation factor